LARPTLRSLLLLASAAVAALVLGGTAPPAHAASTTATFTPGAAWDDTAGSPLQMHGLGIIKVGSTWYAYGEDKAGETSANTSFQAIPCYSSTDLKNWTFVSDALTVQSSGDLGPSRIVERPKVIYNSTTHEYVMWMHIDTLSYSSAEVGVAESATPCGPYTFIGASQPLGFQSRDIGLFQDTNGTAYLLTEDRANGLRIDELSSDYLSVVSANSSIGGSVALLTDLEAPAMVHIGSTYYLLASHLTGWATNDDVYATASSPAGPWSSFQNFAPVGTETYNTQVANIITVAGTSGTTYIYAGDRWTTSDLGDSPMIWLPFTVSGNVLNVGWQNSWQLNVTAGTWQSGTSSPSQSTYKLTDGKSSLVLDVKGSSTSSGAGIVQNSSTGVASQHWKLTAVGTSTEGNVYTLTNANSGLCLAAPSGSTTKGVQLVQAACNGSSGELWAFDAVGSYTSASDATYQIENLGSGLVAEDESNSVSTGAVIDQWASNGGSNQDWTLAVA